MLIFKTTGIVTKASKAFLTKNGVNKEDIIDKSIDSIVQKFEFTNIVADLARGQHVALKRRMFFDSEDKTGVIKYMVFFPIFNITDDFSAAVCIFVSEGKFNKYNQMKKNPESEEDNVYKSSTMMRRIAELFTPEE
jgi:large-conductance mechanosensitive channel